MLRINRMTLEVHAADLTELPAMQARARQLANEEAHLRALGVAAAERARLANLTAAAAFDQVTATLPRIATLGAACPPATRTQLAALLGRTVAATTTPADQDTDSLLGLGAFLAGGVLVDFAKKGKGRTGSRTGAGAVPGGGPGSGGPLDQLRERRRPIWSAAEAHRRRSTWDTSSCTSDRRARLSTGRVGGTSRAISMATTAAPGRWAIYLRQVEEQDDPPGHLQQRPDAEGWRLMDWWRISKYDPTFRDQNGVYQQDEWTDVTDIGRAFDGTTLDLQTYLATEAAYVASVREFMVDANVTTLRVAWLEPPSFMEVLRDYAFPTQQTWSGLLAT
jgi:hypothetical protein